MENHKPQDLTYDSVLFVARNMRQADRDEIYATRWSTDPADLAAACMACPYFAWCFWHDGVPAGVIGAIPKHPGVWNVYAFGTRDFNRVALPMSRHAMRVMIPTIDKVGARRAECLSSANHVEAHRWLEMMGAERESTLSRYGKYGEDFYLYRWLGKTGVLRVE